MQFEWNKEKEKANIKKHKIDFTTAAFVFDDENRIEFFDYGHSTDEDRYITIGMVNGIAVIVTVVYAERERQVFIVPVRANQKER